MFLKPRKNIICPIHRCNHITLNLDGIDLVFEYALILGYSGHDFRLADKDNFSTLVQELLIVMQTYYILSSTAGGFLSFLEQVIDYRLVMPLIYHVNVMSYNVAEGFNKNMDYYTPIFNFLSQIRSAD